MTIDVSKIEPGRETDRLVALALRWTNLRYAKFSGSDPRIKHELLVGDDPKRSGSGWYVPEYSTTDAALEALEEILQGRNVSAEIGIGEPGEPWHRRYSCRVSAEKWYFAPTLYLAICRLIVASVRDEA